MLCFAVAELGNSFASFGIHNETLDESRNLLASTKCMPLTNRASNARSKTTRFVKMCKAKESERHARAICRLAKGNPSIAADTQHGNHEN
jgi:hypothetical protein